MERSGDPVASQYREMIDFEYRLVVSAEMERSGDSVVSQYREIIDLDRDGSTRGPPMQR